MGNKTSSKIKQELTINSCSTIVISDCFVTIDTEMPILTNNAIAAEAKEYVLKFRNALLNLRGVKTLLIPWSDTYENCHDAIIGFDDNIDARGIELLDMIIYLSREIDYDIEIDVKTPLSIDGTSICRIMSGYFEDKEWYSDTAEEARSRTTLTNASGQEIPIPITFRFQEFNIE